MPDWLLFLICLPAIVSASIGIAEVIYRVYCWVLLNQQPRRAPANVVPFTGRRRQTRPVRAPIL